MDDTKFDDLITKLRVTGDPSDKGKLLDELVDVVRPPKAEKVAEKVAPKAKGKKK